MFAYRIGCAGWSVPKADQAAFPTAGTLLQRYAARFSAVEINSTFYHLHRPATYEKWAASVPADFRFAVKLPKAITHEQRLVATDALVDVFLADARCLGEKLGCLLVQLPPSLAYDAPTVESFFRDLRAQYGGAVALEPRHRAGSGTTSETNCVLIALRVSPPTRRASPRRPSPEAGQGWCMYGCMARRGCTTPDMTKSTSMGWRSGYAPWRNGLTTFGSSSTTPRWVLRRLTRSAW